MPSGIWDAILYQNAGASNNLPYYALQLYDVQDSTPPEDVARHLNNVYPPPAVATDVPATDPPATDPPTDAVDKAWVRAVLTHPHSLASRPKVIGTSHRAAGP